MELVSALRMAGAGDVRLPTVLKELEIDFSVRLTVGVGDAVPRAALKQPLGGLSGVPPMAEAASVSMTAASSPLSPLHLSALCMAVEENVRNRVVLKWHVGELPSAQRMVEDNVVKSQIAAVQRLRSIKPADPTRRLYPLRISTCKCEQALKVV